MYKKRKPWFVRHRSITSLLFGVLVWLIMGIASRFVGIAPDFNEFSRNVGAGLVASVVFFVMILVYQRAEEWERGERDFEIAHRLSRIEKALKINETIPITYFVHGTTPDNENGIASGWSQIGLSKTGIKQSKNLKKQIKGKKFDVVFCSDLNRAIESAELTFGKTVPIVQDKRLRECDYGDWTQHSSEEVEQYDCIHKRYPNGESYPDVEKRMRSFLDELLKKYAGKSVAIVSHKAPQLALEVILRDRTWEQAVREDWRSKKPKEWKPGWEYQLTPKA